MLVNVSATIKKLTQLTPDIYQLSLELPCPVAATPGQFVNILIEPISTPTRVMLRRPFSIFDYFQRRLEIVFKVIGKGTRLLSFKKEKDQVGVLGPLGNGFCVNDKVSQIAMVAGGIGIAPFYLLAKETKDRALLLYGAKTKKELVHLQNFKQLGIEIGISTEDGSAGKKGMITDLLAKYISKKDVCVYACGPEPMIKKVASFCLERKIPCQVLLERRMGCGFGACGSCVVKIKSNGIIRYSRLCQEGPVYQADQLIWE